MEKFLLLWIRNTGQAHESFAAKLIFRRFLCVISNRFLGIEPFDRNADGPSPDTEAVCKNVILVKPIILVCEPVPGSRVVACGVARFPKPRLLRPRSDEVRSSGDPAGQSSPTREPGTARRRAMARSAARKSARHSVTGHSAPERGH